MNQGLSVGDRVLVTVKNLLAIKAASRSIHCYPSANFIRRISNQVGRVGEVVFTHLPSDDVTVRFGNELLTLKPGWIERHEQRSGYC